MFEAEDQVGGIAKTEVRDGYRFDLGGHRFFTKSKEVDDLWHEVMKEEFLKRPRMSRIYWNGKFLDYPLNGHGRHQEARPDRARRAAGLSYLWAAIKPKGEEDNLEQWVSNRFGKRLYQHFFKTYTEKVWGVPDHRAARRVGRPADQGPVVLLRRQGRVLRQQGQQDQVADQRVPLPALRPGPDVGDDGRRDHRQRRRGPAQRAGRRSSRSATAGSSRIEAGGERIEPREVISSLPLRATVGLAGAAAAGEVQAAAQGLRYRDFLTVALVIDGEDLFPDNWIYIHEPGVSVGRIQNFRSWSPWMVPDQSKACVGLEYFCFQGDELWEMDDDDARRARPSASSTQLGLGRRRRRSSAASSRACRWPTRCTTPTTPSAST